MDRPRLRQLVFASADAEDIEHLRQILDLGHGFVDPGVSVFGLTNGVFAIGDQFLEVVVPVEETTAAGRFLERSGGIGGYMAIFQTDDLASVRTRADHMKIRRVWDIDVDDISASHLHPADIGAAIVSIDEARPPGSWRWGGPDWTTQQCPGCLQAIEIEARDPGAIAQRWAQVLGIDAAPIGHDIWSLTLADAEITVRPGDRDALIAYGLAHPDPKACLARAEALELSVSQNSFQFAGVQVSLSPIDPAA